jgi:hypothetical protein
VYLDTGLDNGQQTALFAGGLAAGIGTTYLVQAISTVTTPTSPAF